MQTFDVLSPLEQVDQSLFLEASAGTGKTFTIEHLVARLILGEGKGKEPLRIDQILVITFTRAVALELKKRIRDTLHECSLALKKQAEALPYLKEWMDGDEKEHKARMRVERALRFFDEAKVFTIHSFCARALTEHSIEGEIASKLTLSKNEISSLDKLYWIKKWIMDFFDSEKVPFVQMEKLFAKYDYDIKALAKALVPYTQKLLIFNHANGFGIEESLAPYTTLNPEKIVEDFHLLLPCFKGTCTRSGAVQQELSQAIDGFAYYLSNDSFDVDEISVYAVKLASYFQEKNRKKSAKTLPTNYHYAPFMEWFLSDGLTQLAQLGDPDELFGRLISFVSHKMQVQLKNQQSWTPNILIDEMQSKVKDPQFVQSIQGAFKACIIDEFQDTDPAQWAIFSTLFLGDNHSIYLVGDPKQSIYSFRDSDIQVYLEAKKAFASPYIRCLDRNYRSDSKLVEGLNHLFSDALSPHLFKVSSESHLPYVNLKGSEIKEPFSDGKSVIHLPLFIEESVRAQSLPSDKTLLNQFAPYLAAEILHLERNESVSLDDIAILVRDRFQAQKLQEVLKSYGIPSVTKRKQGFAEAKEGVRELLIALANPSDQASFRQFWGGILIKKPQADLAIDAKSWQLAYAHFLGLSREFNQKGILWLIREVLSSDWGQGYVPSHQLLAKDGGEKLYLQCIQLGENLNVDHKNRDPIQLIQTLDTLNDLTWSEDEKALVKEAHDERSVNILTLHVSKGLEFPIVFALGVSSRTQIAGSFNVAKDGTSLYLNNTELQEEKIELTEAEKMRQLYVGLTRASRRLYLPIFVPQGKQVHPKAGQAAPIELYLAQLKNPFRSFHELYSSMDAKMYQNLEKRLKEGSHETISIEYVQKQEVHKRQEVQSSEALLGPKPALIPQCSHPFYSYTSLAKPHVAPIDDPPRDFQAGNKTAHTLPVGMQTGIILHKMLENMNFDSESCTILPLIEGTVYEPWQEVFSSILDNCLHAKLGSELTLADVQVQSVFQEMDFIFKQEDAGEKFPPGYAIGVVDLVFLYQGKIYIIDWKSNYLGPDASFYQEESLKKCMLEHRYHLQVELYAQALMRYIKSISAPWEYGGAFYLFLRGLEKGTSHGVLHLKDK